MTLLINDAFTDADGTLLASHAPGTNVPGNPWVQQSGAWTIDAARGVARTNGDGVATIDSGVADVDLSINVRCSDGYTRGGIVFRWQDATNYLRLYLDENLDTLVLQKKVAGVVTTIANPAFVVATAFFYDVRVIAVGSSIKCHAGGTLLIDTTVSEFSTETEHGLYANGSNSTYFNTFSAALVVPSASVDENGYDVRVTHVGSATTGTSGYTVKKNGSAVTTSWLWSGPVTLRLRVSNADGPLLSTDTITLDYAAGDVAVDGAALGSITGLAATNGSGQTATTITSNGITWTFDEAPTRGISVTGEPWFIAGVAVNSVSPAPTGTGADFRNGSMVNPGNLKQAFDGRAADFDATQAVAYPVTLTAGQSLVSSTSLASIDGAQMTYADKAAVLTCVASAIGQTDFRPHPYTATRTVYSASALATNLLPGAAVTASQPTVAAMLSLVNKPWIETLPGWTGRASRPLGNMKAYGSDISTDVGNVIATLLSDTPYTDELLTATVQRGIDYYGKWLSDAVWVGEGGHASGRFPLILFAGEMLADSAFMASVAAGKSGYAGFGEPEQCFYVSQADLDRAPHTPTNADVMVEYVAGDIGKAEWGNGHARWPQLDNASWIASYRQCCTAAAWWGYLLAAHVFDWWADLPASWLALRDYQDRYRTDEAAAGGANLTLSSYALEMWDAHVETYRATDTTAPTVTAATVNAAGTEIALTLDEACIPASGTLGFTLSGTTATVASWAISGTALTLTLAGIIPSSETVTLSYSSVTGGIEDAGGNALVTFADYPLVNGSEVLVSNTVEVHGLRGRNRGFFDVLRGRR